MTTVSVKSGKGSRSASRAASSLKKQRALAVVLRRNAGSFSRSLRVGGVHTFTRKLDLAASPNSSVNGICTAGSAVGVYRLTQTSLAATSVNFGGLTWFFSLNDLPDYTNFTQLFDQYRVVKLSVKMMPFSTSAATSSPTTITSTSFINVPAAAVHAHQIVDYDDNVLFTPTYAGLQTMREFENHRSWNALDGKQHWCTWRPHNVTSVGVSGSSALAGNTPAKWLDTVNASVVHYGLKMMFEMNGGADGSLTGLAASTFDFRLECTATIQFKNVR